jgi:hypothetical protein
MAIVSPSSVMNSTPYRLDIPRRLKSQRHPHESFADRRYKATLSRLAFIVAGNRGGWHSIRPPAAVYARTSWSRKLGTGAIFESPEVTSPSPPMASGVLCKKRSRPQFSARLHLMRAV